MNELHVELLAEGYSWIDTGTHYSLFEAALYIKEIEKTSKHKNRMHRRSCIQKGAYLKKAIKIISESLIKK